MLHIFKMILSQLNQIKIVNLEGRKEMIVFRWWPSGGGRVVA